MATSQKEESGFLPPIDSKKLTKINQVQASNSWLNMSDVSKDIELEKLKKSETDRGTEEQKAPPKT